MDKHDAQAYTAHMEEFANLTTRAFNEGDIEKGLRYLDYIERKLTTASELELEYIDVYFVEHLFWIGTDAGITAGWPLLPPSLKKLYLRFHGQAPNSKR